MNDLDLVREMRAEVPVPAAARLADGRTRLLAAAGREQPTVASRPPHARFFRPSRTRRGAILLPATAAAAAVAVVAGVAGYGLSTGSGPAAAPTASTVPTASAAPSAEQAILAARVLRAASAAAGRAPVTAEPGPGQWIYSKTVQYEYPQGTSSDEKWITFGGGKTAYYQDGQLVVHASPVSPPAGTGSDPLAAFNADTTPKTAYDALASLPADPHALLDAAGKAAAAIGAANLGAGTPVAGHPPKTRGQLEFDYLALLLWNAAGGVGGPPKAEAAAFRAMATLSGVTVQQGITDAAGAPAIGVSADGYDQLLLDPRSYQVIGLRQLSTGVGPRPAVNPQSLAKLSKAERQRIVRKQERKAATQWPRKGAVVFSLAYARVGEVSGPGIR